MLIYIQNKNEMKNKFMCIYIINPYIIYILIHTHTHIYIYYNVSYASYNIYIYIYIM